MVQLTKSLPDAPPCAIKRIKRSIELIQLLGNPFIFLLFCKKFPLTA